MKRRDEVIGLPVVEELSGQIVGRVRDLDYTPGSRAISGLVVERSGIRRPIYVNKDRILIIGDHAVIIEQGEHVPAPRRKSVSPYTRAYLPDGREAGVITDYSLDPKTAAVTQLELSRGMVDDLIRGRQHISHFALMEFSQDIVVWPESWQDEERGE